MAREDDQALVAAVLRGDAGSAEALFDRIFDGLYRQVCSRLNGDHHTSQDIVSESLSAGLRSIGSFRGEASLETWFLRIALRKIADEKRRKAAILVAMGDGEFEAMLKPRAPAEPSALDRLAGEETRALVNEVLDSLPRRHKAILRWKYMDESSVGEVASRLGVSPKAAERRLARAREALASALRKRHLEA